MKILHFKSPKRSLPMILQDEIAECGHACVAMISQFWGHGIDLMTLRKKRSTSLQGINLREIIQLFESLSFQTYALQVPLADLNKIACPAILHWNMNHFVVLKKVRKNKFVIHDPAIGVRRLNLEEMSRSFTGIVLEVKKNLTFTPLKVNEPLKLSHLSQHISGLKPMLWGLLCLSVLIEALNLVSPILIQFLTDHVLTSSHKDNLLILLGVFALLMSLLMVTTHQRAHLILYLKMHLTEKLSYGLMRHLFKLPLKFYETRHKGDLHSKMNAMNEIQQKLSTDFISAVLDSLMICFHLIIMSVYSPLLAIVVMGMLIFYSAVRMGSHHSLQLARATAIHQHAKTASTFLESLQAIVPLKTFMKESLSLNKWHAHLIEALNHDIAGEKIQIRYRSFYLSLNQAEYIVVIALGTMLILKHQFSLGMLFAFLAFRQQLVGKWESLMQHMSEYRLISIQLNRLSDILFEPGEVYEDKPQVKPIKGELQLEHISFRYQSHLPDLFANLSLHIHAGEKIAIVGPSGCGKTTLLKLMMGLLEATTGQISIDGVVLSDYGIKSYRLSIASVMQDDCLFSGSILDNITFFAEEIDYPLLEEVVQIAQMETVIKQLPMKYETLIGEMGSTLSGGQKQRLLLARALYKKPKIIFLDEATSHLDKENEILINQALQALQITQVIIAHRQETIKMADRVIDLSKM